MSPETVQFSIIGGMLILIGIVYNSGKKKRDTRGSISSSVSKISEDVKDSLKTTADSLDSSPRALFRDSPKSNYSNGSRSRSKSRSRSRSGGTKKR